MDSGSASYRYELWQQQRILTTGLLTLAQRLEVGDRLEVDGCVAVVRKVDDGLGAAERRLVLRVQSSAAAA